MNERNEAKAIMDYRLPPPRWLAVIGFVLIAPIMLVVVACMAVRRFFRWMWNPYTECGIIIILAVLTAAALYFGFAVLTL